MRGEKLASSDIDENERSPWDGIGQDEISSEERFDAHGRDVNNISDLEKLSPVEQLKFLSDTAEAAEADTFYAICEAKDIFYAVSDDERLPPLVRIVAEAAKSSDPNDAPDEWTGIERNGNYAKEEYGYYSIISPESMPNGILTEDELRMNEQELKEKIENLENEPVPDIYGDDAYGIMSYGNVLEYALERKYFQKNQAKLHQEFPFLPEDRQLVKVASDAAATVNFEKKYDDEDWFAYSGSIDLISDKDGRMTSLSKPNKNNDIGLDSDAISYLGVVHGNNFTKQIINKKIGLNLADVPLGAQVQLLKFMTEAGDTRFDSLCSTLHKVEPELRLKLAEGFLAADFGEDFGDALLDIANSERISGEQLGEILDQIGSCRESIRGITGLYDDFDRGKFAGEYARAANERLTDAIMVFREIADKGKAEVDLGWAGEVELSYDEALEALTLEAKSLSTINGVLSDVQEGKEDCFAEMILSPDAEHRRSYYNLYSPEHGYALLYVRPEGSSSFDPTIEYGKYRSRYNEDGNNVGTEASISLIANPVDPFSTLNPFRPDRRKVRDPEYYDGDTMNKVSAIRLDREGRAPGAAADDPARSPIAEEGMVSVDLAAIGDRFDTPSGKIARLVSAGNKIRQERNGDEGDFSLNHNVGWFDQDEYGKASGFKEVAEYVDRNVRALCILYPPKSGEGYAGEAEKLHKKELRAAQRERGRMAMRGFDRAA